MADKFTSGRIDTHEYVAKMKKADGDIAEAVAELESAIANAKGFAGDIPVEQRTQGNHWWIAKANYPTATGLYRLVKNGVVVGFFDYILYYYYFYGMYMINGAQYMIPYESYISTSTNEFQLDQSQYAFGDRHLYLHKLYIKPEGTITYTDTTTETVTQSYPYKYLMFYFITTYSAPFTSATLSSGKIKLTFPSGVASSIASNIFAVLPSNGDYLVFTWHDTRSPDTIQIDTIFSPTKSLCGTINATSVSVNDSVAIF